MAYPPTILIASASCLTTSTVIPEIASSSQRRRSGSISSTALDGASSLAVTYKPEDIEFVCAKKKLPANYDALDTQTRILEDIPQATG